MTVKNFWSSDAREEYHDNYWRQLEPYILGEKFEEVWYNMNQFEFFKMSEKGKNLALIQGKFAKLQFVLNLLNPFGPSWPEAITSKPFYDVVLDGHIYKKSYREALSLFEKYIIQSITKNALNSKKTLFVDLGSGWGRISTKIALALPESKVYALELSSGGREVCSKLSSRHFPNIIIQAFDYRDWQESISKINHDDYENLVVFSNHSIEQVDYIDPKMLEKLAKIEKPVSFIHTEPVGWQFGSKDKRFTSEPGYKSQNNAGYNQNLASTLNELHLAGLITKPSVKLNYFAFENTENTGTQIEYQNIR